MIPPAEIAAMKNPSQGNTWADDAKALNRLLFERHLLVAFWEASRETHEAYEMSAAASIAWEAVEAFH